MISYAKESSELERKIVSRIALMLLLAGMVSPAFIEQVKASDGTIYIRADGSVDPPTAPIQRDGDIYTFTGSIYEEIVVQRNNIVIDGNGCTLQGTEAYDSKGIDLAERTNVKIVNLEIKGFCFGIWLHYSDHNSISGNSMTDNVDGICLHYFSPHNTISENNIANNEVGVDLDPYADYNSISGNNIANNQYDGIDFDYSSNNNISDNNIANNGYYGIDFREVSNGNIISGNNITNNSLDGIFLEDSSNNKFYHNNLRDNGQQVYSYRSVNVWDDGYPSGGNYWSDYTERYPDAKEIDGSGIWDTPYVIDDYNRDRYPLVKPWTPIPIEKPLHIKAAELVKRVIGKSYRTELGNRFTKGWKDERFVNATEIVYLDCSGLVYWGYNKAYSAAKYSPWDEESYTVIDRQEVKFYNPIAFEGAENQYRYNTERIDKTDLQPGDLLFFNTPDRGNPDHVAMYVGGPFEYKYGQDKVFKYNTVEATVWGDTIITVAFYDVVTGCLTTLRPSTSETRTLKVDYYGRVKFPVIIPFGVARMMGIMTKSAVDLIITDPEGFTITIDMREASNMIYLEFDINEDGEPDDIVLVLERRMGDYLITMIPEPDAAPTETYTLEVWGDSMSAVLAENVQIINIPAQPYVVESTEMEIIPILPVTTDFDPDTLNLKSAGEWVTVYMELPVGHGYDASQVDVSSLKLDDTVPALSEPTQIGDYDGDGTADLMVKFDRAAVIQWLGAMDCSQDIGKSYTIKLTITGTVAGMKFKGTDIVRILKN